MVLVLLFLILFAANFGITMICLYVCYLVVMVWMLGVMFWMLFIVVNFFGLFYVLRLLWLPIVGVGVCLFMVLVFVWVCLYLLLDWIGWVGCLIDLPL